MPWDVQFLKNGCVRRFHGHVTYDDFFQSSRAMTESPLADDVVWMLEDSVDVLSYALQDDEIVFILGFLLKRVFPNCRCWALAVGPGETPARHLQTRFQKLMAPGFIFHTAVFDRVDEARQWASQWATAATRQRRQGPRETS